MGCLTVYSLAVAFGSLLCFSSLPSILIIRPSDSLLSALVVLLLELWSWRVMEGRRVFLLLSPVSPVLAVAGGGGVYLGAGAGWILVHSGRRAGARRGA